jgi:hypothetical protein
MERSERDLQRSAIIDPQRFGVSFSIKQCRNFGIDPRKTLEWLIHDAGFRRFRFMSYWDEIEKKPGEYNFSVLDWQIEEASKNGCLVTLCLGARQPRWPENHWPNWAWEATFEERSAALLTFIEEVVKRYRDRDVIVSYQLENEALLEGFGRRPEVNRKRLRQEYKLVKKLDPKKPVIMTTSTSWGIPLRRPIPDIIGFSYYRILYGGGKYHHAFHFPRLDKIRAAGNKIIHRRPSFIHELQLEPWGPTAIWKMSVSEQDKSMSVAHIAKNVKLARKTKLYPVDIWGAEWWYWRYKSVQDPSIWLAVQSALLK